MATNPGGGPIDAGGDGSLRAPNHNADTAQNLFESSGWQKGDRLPRIEAVASATPIDSRLAGKWVADEASLGAQKFAAVMGTLSDLSSLRAAEIPPHAIQPYLDQRPTLQTKAEGLQPLSHSLQTVVASRDAMLKSATHSA